MGMKSIVCAKCGAKIEMDDKWKHFEAEVIEMLGYRKMPEGWWCSNCTKMSGPLTKILKRKEKRK